jgi:hypothetical protein
MGAYGEVVDSSAVVSFPVDRDAAGATESGSVALAEIDAAIALVASRLARRVRLIALPFSLAVAGIGLARARAAGMAFRIERTERAGVASVTVGPIE